VATWSATAGVVARGVCVVLGGQTEFLEKYLEVFRELADRGFSGASLDWRGQGGSERLLPDPLKAHVRDFSDYDDDLSVFLDEVVRPISDRPPLALAHSMGAHILLRTLHARPDSFAAAVMTAPMLQIDTRGFPTRLVRFLCSTHARAGLEDDWVWGMKRRDPLRLAFNDNRVTSDPDRFARTVAILRDHRDVRLSGPTWGWLDAADRSMKALMAPGFPEAISTPCLLFGAGRDRIVQTRAIRQFAHRLPRGKYVEIAGAQHEILMENDAIRAQFWRHFDRFADDLASLEERP
jgi:lysophospholipase